jgi:tellurite resistance protein TerC
MFFLLRGAAARFDYLQQGIAIVLVFIGVKMLLPMLEYVGVDPKYLHFPVWVSLLVIICCIGGSIWYSIRYTKPGSPTGLPDDYS